MHRDFEGWTLLRFVSELSPSGVGCYFRSSNYVWTPIQSEKTYKKIIFEMTQKLFKKRVFKFFELTYWFYIKLLKYSQRLPILERIIFFISASIKEMYRFWWNGQIWLERIWLVLNTTLQSNWIVMFLDVVLLISFGLQAQTFFVYVYVRSYFFLDVLDVCIALQSSAVSKKDFLFFW